MKKLYIFFAILGFYRLCNAMDPEHSSDYKNKIREYYATRRAYGLAKNALSVYLMQQKYNDKPTTFDTTYRAAENRLSQTKLDFKQSEKWMIAHGYLK